MRRALSVLGATCVTGAIALVPALANAQVGSSNVPLPNVMLLLDTSGSFEYMIDGSKPEDPINNPTGGPYANCEQAFNTLGTTAPVPALPNRWGVLTQALTGTILNDSNVPFYSCVTMDRLNGPLASSLSVPAGATPTSLPGSQMAGPFLLSTTGANANLTKQVYAEGLDIQYGLRNEAAGAYSIPYDSGYYLPFHRPVSAVVNGTAFPERCVYSPGVLPGASATGGVGIVSGKGYPATNDCPNEGASTPCKSTDFPANAIGSFYYDQLPATGGASSTGTALTSSTWNGLTTPNAGYAGSNVCTFQQATDGLMDQATSLVRFGLMTFDNDPDPDTGSSLTSSTGYDSAFLGQWSYFKDWSTFPVPSSSTPTPAATALCGGTATISDTCGMPAQCAYSPFELGARNNSAPPWEGRLIGFPDPNADVLATQAANNQIQTAINAMRPYGATPTAALMSDAAYYFWADPNGPNSSTNPDPLVAGNCRSQYIILLTDGGPNLDLRPSCQGSTGVCPYHSPEETAYLLATGGADTAGSVYSTLPSPPTTNARVYTYVIGFAVSNDNAAATSNLNLANCSELSASQLAACGAGGGAPGDFNDGGVSAESPCCSLQRIAVAGGTGHAYFADTPGNLNAALAAVLGDIEGQLGSRTLPVASPTVSYATGSPTTASFVSTFQAASTCPATGPCTTAGAWTGDVLRQDFSCGMSASMPVAGDDFGNDSTTGLTKQNSSGVSRNYLVFNSGNKSYGPATGTNGLTIRPYLGGTSLSTIGSAPADNLDAFGSSTGQQGHEVMSSGGTSSIFQEITSTGVAPCTSASCPSLATTNTSCEDPATRVFADPTSCANLAMAFTLGLNSFTADSGDPAGSNLATLFNSGTDGNNSHAPTGATALTPTNRSATPLGGILDSTPAVIGLPSAQVRDDSYQAFAKAIAAASPARDTTLYVATIDGMLHAFDTTVGYTGGATWAESWAFIPPAVLPNLMSNYPAANNILLDGAPVVKDVVFNRTAPGAADQDGKSPWHTMLVAGFGAGGRGYYALDVTDPRKPASAPGPITTFASEAYNTYASATAGASPTLTGPHFQWQITGANLTGQTKYSPALNTWPVELFGSTSGTPAIATVFADPSMQPVGTQPSGLNPQELGVAILPGGSNGPPVPGGTCPRELLANAGSYKVNTGTLFAGLNGGTGATLSSGGASTSPFNLTDPNFPPRLRVRQWSPGCSLGDSNNPNGLASNVPGRSVMVVSIATGQILAVFARAQPSTFASAKNPNSWDFPTDGKGNTIITSDYLRPTPLDSPMTGIPVAYPSGVGVVAQAFYIGDADGTMWRFDVSDPNPRNWVGSIFADAYSPGSGSAPDGSGGDSATASSSPDWPALDSQAIAVPPVLALDSTATLTVDFSTGDQTSFNACYSVPGLSVSATASKYSTAACNAIHATAASGPVAPVVNFLYSVAETRVGTASIPLARVNWYNQWTSGERVTGPMAIFNGILYFASYAPSTKTGGGTFGTPITTDSGECKTGGANLFAWDFSKPSLPCTTGPASDLIGCGGSGLLNGSPIDPNFTSASSDPTDPTSTSSATAGRLPSIADPTGVSTSLATNVVIPGVTIGQTPSCVTVTSVPADGYGGALHNTFSQQNSGTYSLTANIGKKSSGTTAKSNIITQKLKAPTAPTIVDSWATIAE